MSGRTISAVPTTTRSRRTWPWGRRWPLTIAVGRPGAETLSRMWRIRDGIRPGENTTQPQKLAYPHAVEHDGKLYVVYSVGHGANRNRCELAVIPVASLEID